MYLQNVDTSITSDHVHVSLCYEIVNMYLNMDILLESLYNKYVHCSHF